MATLAVAVTGLVLVVAGGDGDEPAAPEEVVATPAPPELQAPVAPASSDRDRSQRGDASPGAGRAARETGRSRNNCRFAHTTSRFRRGQAGGGPVREVRAATRRSGALTGAPAVAGFDRGRDEARSRERSRATARRATAGDPAAARRRARGPLTALGRRGALAVVLGVAALVFVHGCGDDSGPRGHHGRGYAGRRGLPDPDLPGPRGPAGHDGNSGGGGVSRP